MSENTPEPVRPVTGGDGANTDTPAKPAEPAATDPKPTETVEFWKQKAREQEQRAKSNAQKAQEFDALQESQKTEQQKIADRAAAAERARDEAVAEGLRYKAAAKHGVGEDFFDLIGSGDEETIYARAERIGGLLKVSAENEQLKAELEAIRAGKPAPATGTPKESLKPGASPVEITPPVDDSYPAHWIPKRA